MGFNTTEYGQYTTKRGAVFAIYLTEHQGGINAMGDPVPPNVQYSLDTDGKTTLLLWTDWLSFAHKVNAMAVEEILAPMGDPAVELGLAVGPEAACPHCSCRLVDWLRWKDNMIKCAWCGNIYTP